MYIREDVSTAYVISSFDVGKCAPISNAQCFMSDIPREAAPSGGLFIFEAVAPAASNTGKRLKTFS